MIQKVGNCLQRELWIDFSMESVIMLYLVSAFTYGGHFGIIWNLSRRDVGPSIDGRGEERVVSPNSHKQGIFRKKGCRLLLLDKKSLGWYKKYCLLTSPCDWEGSATWIRSSKYLIILHINSQVGFDILSCNHFRIIKFFRTVTVVTVVIFKIINHRINVMCFVY